jgi:hypothetical protein
MLVTHDPLQTWADSIKKSDLLNIARKRSRPNA